MNPHRHLKEEFVSNLDGTSMSEIAILSAAMPALVVLRMFGMLCWESGVKTKCWFSLLLDLAFLVLPTLLILTFFADYVFPITVAILLLMVAALRYANLQQQPSSFTLPLKKPFLTNYRFVMMLVTCVTILAVDFTLFPRRYAKTETYGTGLMDLGVGSFVVANAVVSKQARSSAAADRGTWRSSVPLILLGLARLISTNRMEYQVHVGEYGVHWNFFFTLAAVSLITLVIRPPAAYSAVFGLCILTVHQCFLLFGLNTYLLSPERGPGLLSLNKEGVYSVLGYWGLYLLSLQLGRHMFLSPGSLFGRRKSSKWLLAAEIWILDAILWTLVVFLDTFVERVSRRTCNMAYAILVLAQNLEVIGIFSLADCVLPVNLLLVDAFDSNLMATFLVANLLTGLVNIFINTISIQPVSAFTILLTYMTLLGVTMSVLKSTKNKSKDPRN